MSKSSELRSLAQHIAALANDEKDKAAEHHLTCAAGALDEYADEAAQRSETGTLDMARSLTQTADYFAAHGKPTLASDCRVCADVLATMTYAPPSARAAIKEPPPGLLVSIALRLDHGLFSTPPYAGEDRKRYIEVALADARRAWEEVTGNGFWSPERNTEYEAMLAAPLPGPYEPPMVYDPQQGKMVKPGVRNA